MRDFTLQAYSRYLQVLQATFRGKMITFSEYLGSDPRPDVFCIVRHDVDRFPGNALKMAKLENDLGIRATYYFRTKSHTFKPSIIKEIHALGHEVGYHYESLSDTNGDKEKALVDFEKNLKKLREFVPVATCSMHGRPLKRFDNRDLWREQARRSILHSELDILGEIYLDIDYSNTAYINDAGRNWFQKKNNIRDHVDSDLEMSFESGNALLHYLQDNPHEKTIFQVHPENWNDGYLRWLLQFFFVSAANIVKNIYAKTYQ